MQKVRKYGKWAAAIAALGIMSWCTLDVHNTKIKLDEMYKTAVEEKRETEEDMKYIRKEFFRTEKYMYGLMDSYMERIGIYPGGIWRPKPFYEKRKKISLCSIIERDPKKWETLPMPEGSYRKGSGKDCRVILKRPQFSNFEKEDEVIFMEFKQNGNFNLIAVETGAGIFYARPGENFDVGLTREELFAYTHGTHVPFYVMGIEKQTDVNYKITASYKAFL